MYLYFLQINKLNKEDIKQLSPKVLKTSSKKFRRIPENL